MIKYQSVGQTTYFDVAGFPGVRLDWTLNNLEITWQFMPCLEGCLFSDLIVEVPFIECQFLAVDWMRTGD